MHGNPELISCGLAYCQSFTREPTIFLSYSLCSQMLLDGNRVIGTSLGPIECKDICRGRREIHSRAIVGNNHARDTLNRPNACYDAASGNLIATIHLMSRKRGQLKKRATSVCKSCDSAVLRILSARHSSNSSSRAILSC